MAEARKKESDGGESSNNYVSSAHFRWTSLVLFLLVEIRFMAKSVTNVHTQSLLTKNIYFKFFSSRFSLLSNIGLKDDTKE